MKRLTVAGFSTSNNTFGDLLLTIDDARDDLQVSVAFVQCRWRLEENLRAARDVGGWGQHISTHW